MGSSATCFVGARALFQFAKHKPVLRASSSLTKKCRLSFENRFTIRFLRYPTVTRMTSTDSMQTERGEKELMSNVLKFWFGDDNFPPYENYEGQGELWYGSSEETDTTIRQRFGRATDDAIAGKYDHWMGNKNHGYKSDLALVVMLDQFSRNIYRGSEKAFEGDAKARAVVQRLLDTGEWKGLKDHFSPVARCSFLLCLMHQESLDDQIKCMELIESMIEECKSAGKEAEKTIEILHESLYYAQTHRDIIEQFGRFPHRNKALSRLSTPEEERYLIDGPRFGQ